MQEKIIENLNNLFNFLNRLAANDKKRRFAEYVLGTVEKILASNKLFYEEDKKNKEIRSKTRRDLIENLDTTSEDIFNLVDMELNNPFSIFYNIMQFDIPDIILTNRLIKIQLNQEDFLDIDVPEELIEIFGRFLEHFINNLKYINEMKFDMVEATQDITFREYRFNFVHASLNITGSPIVSIRKHITNVKGFKKTEEFDSEVYEASLEIPKETIEKIKKTSCKSFVIYGDTGSGKTTLLRYLIQCDFDKKRNVCIIEDSAELFINTAISLITNKNHTIHDLFVSALRQNPSHLIVGETRTDEIIDILESALTFSVATTIHATSFQRAIERIYWMSGKRKKSREDIHSLIAASITMFICMEDRKVKEVVIRNSNKEGSIYNMYDIIYSRKDSIE